MEIKWKDGSHHKVDAEVAYKEIEAVREKNGGSIPAEAVVEAAKRKRNPLHPEFEWNDSAAGHQFRLTQARKIIHSLVVVRDEIKSERPQRVYEVVKLPQEQTDDGKPARAKHVYKSLEDVMADPDMRSEILGRALRDLIAIRNRYRDLQELAVVMRAIDEVLTEGAL